jgi:parallel beta-helix repeat protein
MHRKVAGAGFLIGILILIAGASAVDITGCGEINAAGTYELKNDILGVPDPSCIRITTSDVIVRGNNYIIRGKDIGNSVGILVQGTGTLSRVSIENLRLANWTYGIRAEGVKECRIAGCQIDSGIYGITVVDVKDSRIEGNTVSHTTIGITLEPAVGTVCRGNVISENTLRENWGDGISVIGEENVISGNTVTSNDDGIVITGPRNRIENNRFEDNTNGIHSVGLSQGTLAGNLITANRRNGILFWDQSNENDIRENTITSNGECGFFILISKGNSIHNNVFSNTHNVDNHEDYPNTWNTPRTRGVNIVGGPHLGGNYWGQPDGKGFSQTCTDANPIDGICDTEYPLAKDNTDLLPLTNLSGKTGMVTPDADTYVNAGAGYDQIYGKRVPVRDLNFGGSSGIVVQRGQRCMPGFSFWEAGLIRFNLSHIDPAVGIRKATLKLTQSTLNAERVGVHRMLVPWSEREATFNRPSTVASPWSNGWDGGVNFALSPTDTVSVTGEVGRTFAWDVTADVQAFVADAPNHGWILRSAETQGQSDYSRTAFYSRESTAGGVYRGPVLEIEFGPGGGGDAG